MHDVSVTAIDALAAEGASGHRSLNDFIGALENRVSYG
jgi:hypothetical protein